MLSACRAQLAWSSTDKCHFIAFQRFLHLDHLILSAQHHVAECLLRVQAYIYTSITSEPSGCLYIYLCMYVCQICIYIYMLRKSRHKFNLSCPQASSLSHRNTCMFQVPGLAELFRDPRTFELQVWQPWTRSNPHGRFRRPRSEGSHLFLSLDPGVQVWGCCKFT